MKHVRGLSHFSGERVAGAAPNRRGHPAVPAKPRIVPLLPGR